MKKILKLLTISLGYLVSIFSFFVAPSQAQVISNSAQVKAERLPGVVIAPLSVFKCKTRPAPTTVFAELIFHVHSSSEISRMTGPKQEVIRRVWGKRKKVFIGGGPVVFLRGVGQEILGQKPTKKSLGFSTYHDEAFFRFPRGSGNKLAYLTASIDVMPDPLAHELSDIVERVRGLKPVPTLCTGFPKDERDQQEQRAPRWKLPKFGPDQCQAELPCPDYCGNGKCGDWASCSSRSVALANDGFIVAQGETVSYVG